MAIDPNIALGVKPPQLPTVADIQQHQMALKNMRSSDALQSQQLEMNKLNLSKMQRSEADDIKKEADKSTYEGIVKGHTAWDPEKGISIDHGAVQNDLIQAGLPDVASAYAANQVAVHKAAVEDTLKEIELHTKKIDRMAALAQSVLTADPKDRPGRYSIALQQAQQEGLLTPEMMSQVSQQYDPATTDNMLQEMVGQSMSVKDQLAQAQAKLNEQREVEKTKREGAQADANLLKTNVENEAQILGAAKDQAGWSNALAQLPKDRQEKYPTTFSEQARQQAQWQGVSPSTRATLEKADSEVELVQKAAKGDKDAQKALEDLKKYHIDVETAKVQAQNAAALGGVGKNVAPGIPGQRNEAALEGLSPGIQAVIKQLADYKMQLPGGMALKSPYWQNILERTAQYDPDFDSSQYNVRVKLRQDFTSGKSADNVKALNTAVGHLDTLNKAGQALNNSTIKRYNSVKNWLAGEAGSKSVTDFKLAQNAVADELTKVFRGTGGTESDVKGWKESIDAAGSPEQLKSAVNGAIELMASRLMALNSQYEKGMGRPKDFSFLDDKARKILKSLGADVDNLDPTATRQAAGGPKGDVTTQDNVITEDLIKQGLGHNKLKDTPENRAELVKALKEAGYVEKR